ncbi:DNA gyrase subunit A [Undibacter mobilis]|uniref:DNA gyrase subunit A n=1 Tax=Undibacter mobilis TaxID=2292256 RepID=A0A371B0Q7_9BRAD|nr:DNA gyrase subunit A [Undibacter mobilis]RDV01117.1 DNA gyrase subunit A [Undibacter mobilis]
MSDTEIPKTGGENPSDVRPISITEEMKRSYLDYAMSVIVSRALPDVRDGLKPVHRRILYSMHEQGHTPDKKYVKSARVVGDVMGKYHPHGDSAIYDALVRMAQDFSMRLMLIDGQGNFGSVDGDPAAAMRYTECRLAKPAMALLDDIDKNTVDFQDNYDGNEQEPAVLPARYPNLLVNGAGGIAVGMATNIPPHNLGEVIDACVAMIDNPAITTDDLLNIVPGPDFPTGGIILGRSGIYSAFTTGRGSVVMRGKVAFETFGKDRESIIISEIPYQVNKATMVERIAELVRDKKIEGISDLRDESDRDGYRVVIELKRDAEREVVLNQLYRFTPLQTSFGVNMVALDGGRPLLMTLKDMLTAFVAFREEVVSRRTKFLLGKARDRAHILVGLAIAVANIDEVIKLIRASKDAKEAREALMARDWPAKDMINMVLLIDDPRHRVSDTGSTRLSAEQAQAILDLRLQRLTALGRDEIKEELDKLAAEIADYLDILRSRARIQTIIKDDLAALKAQFATPRRTEISEAAGDMDDEDLIQREDMVVTVSHLGYVKRVPLSTYRAQRRGGKGRGGMQVRDEDFVARLFVASTHTPVLFFSSAGKVYKEKVWRLPLAAPQARGKAFINILPLDNGETITSIMPLPEDEKTWGDLDVMFATTKGTVRRNKLSDFVEVRRSGIIAMKLADGEGIVGVQICTEKDDVLLTSSGGQCIRFAVPEVRVFTGRTSMGVRGIALEDDDRLISMSILRHSEASSEERAAYLKKASAVRRSSGGDDEAVAAMQVEAEENVAAIEISEERYVEMSAAEQFVLTLSERGYGKRTSSYEYRITGRGGKGIVAMDIWQKAKGGGFELKPKIGRLTASFPIEEDDQVMLVTNAGKLIRTPVTGIRLAGRSTQGVIVLDTADDERVVSVERLSEDEGGE